MTAPAPDVAPDPAGETIPPVLAACDLDRTLIYSTAALHPPEAEGTPPPGDGGLRCVEHYRGQPQSFVTETAAALLAELTRVAVLVPATTRTVEQYRRVRLPGRPSRYAVCANGGRLLVDGASDAGWERHVADTLAAVSAPFDEVLNHLERAAGVAGWPHRVRGAEGLFCYLVAEPADVPAGWTAELTDWAAAHGWAVSTQGRKTYLVPGPLTKEAAVAEVARRTGAGEILAAGDALLDAGLLTAADHGWRPGHGELAATGWAAPHVTALTTRGVACAEQILTGMLNRVHRPRPGGTPAPRRPHPPAPSPH